MKILALLILSLFTTQIVHADLIDDDRPDAIRPLRLPSAFDSFTITHGTILRLDSGEVNYKIRINAHLPRLGMITQAQVIRYPHQILIDKKRGIGVFTEKLDSTGADVYMATGGVGESKSFARGVYIVKLRMKNGRKVEGRFTINQRLAPAAPDLLSPVAGQNFTTGNPVFAWQNFFSPQYSGYEERKVYARVYQGSEVIWAAYQADADINQITVGQAQSQEGATALLPGNYEAHIVYREGTPFGRVWFGREYRTVSPFLVR